MSYSRSAQSSRSQARPGQRLGSDNRSGSPSNYPRSQGRSVQGLPRSARAAPSNSRNLSSSTTESRSSSSAGGGGGGGDGGGGSFLDRIRAPSSRTSLEDDYENSGKQRERGKTSSRSRVTSDSYDDNDEQQSEGEAPAPGYGHDIWSRVTTVASQLTINVSQAWQKSIHLVDGEVTPPGGESRLTKAMKAYHLAKAKSPSDLPVWLFEEHERGVTSRTWRSWEREEYEDRFLPEKQQEPVKRSGLRDIYDSVPRSSGSSGGNANTNTNTSATTQMERGSRATDRLRAIREAKRSPAQTSPTPPQGEVSYERGAARRPPAPRGGGLPSRPTRRI